MTFDKATYTVNEDTGTVKPLLILSNPSSFIETVQVITTDITTNGKVILMDRRVGNVVFHTTGNSDYSPGPYFVFFPVQTTNSSLVIALNDDSLSEPNEEFNISITSFANDFVVGTPRVATVTIIGTYVHTIVCMYCIRMYVRECVDLDCGLTCLHKLINTYVLLLHLNRQMYRSIMLILSMLSS